MLHTIHTSVYVVKRKIKILTQYIVACIVSFMKTIFGSVKAWKADVNKAESALRDLIKAHAKLRETYSEHISTELVRQTLRHAISELETAITDEKTRMERESG